MAQTFPKYKVLIASMSLDLGGAETHIVELCLKLKNRGLEVVVVSSGGIFVERLRMAGIRHIEAPLHSRSFSSMLQARKILAQILRQEQPDMRASLPFCSPPCAKCRKLRLSPRCTAAMPSPFPCAF